jgi:hypothetical protein
MTVGAFESFIARENPKTREFKRRRKNQEFETRMDRKATSKPAPFANGAKGCGTLKFKFQTKSKTNITTKTNQPQDELHEWYQPARREVNCGKSRCDRVRRPPVGSEATEPMDNFVRKFRGPIVIVIFLFTVFYPFEIRIAPDWVARVIDENGQPVARAQVEETWQEYSLEEVAHYDHRTTASDGIVHFQPHTMRASFASRVSGCLHNFRRTVHASCGASSWVGAYKCTYGELRTDWERTQGNSWQGFGLSI